VRFFAFAIASHQKEKSAICVGRALLPAAA